MKRNVLLLEPNYSNKYPPMGLMKIASYHKLLGDNVKFYKGDLKEFVVQEIFLMVKEKLYDIDEGVLWEKFKLVIVEFIKTGHISLLDDINSATYYSTLATDLIKYYRHYYLKKNYFKDKPWDRICITSLFTFHWKITVETIEFAKDICKDISQIWVGGILASVVPEELKIATGVTPWVGLLDKEGILDDNALIIENMCLDYSILDEIDYVYPENNAYYAYMTRGCIRKCNFCVVPSIEPIFIPYITLNHKIDLTSKQYGEQRNLLLLDNNVLASPKFEDIVNEIKSQGFYKGAKYYEPNWLDIAIKNLELGTNDFAYLNRIHRLLMELLKRIKNEKQQNVYNIMSEYNLLSIHTMRKDMVMQAYPLLKEIYEKRRSKLAKNRYVDFNQGLDARLINDDNIKLLSQLPINPMRIAFDHWKEREYYVAAVRKAAENGIRNLSNYLLYNYKDKPVDLFYRLKLNIELCESLEINIYSFPMKYHPIKDPVYFQNRDYIGTHWNKKFVRAVQAVLNSTKGKIGRGKSFFEAAFGKNEEEYYKILYMPEKYIIYREINKESGATKDWWNLFKDVRSSGSYDIIKVIESSSFKNLDTSKFSKIELALLKYYMNEPVSY